MRTITLLVTSLSICIDLFSQSVRDVRYRRVDSIDTTYVGQRVKIDFKPKWFRDELQDARAVDTIAISLDNKQFSLIEVKGTTADSWIFDWEYLKSYDYDKKYILHIKDIVVIDLSADSIMFRMTLLLKKSDEEDSRLVNSFTKDIWISKTIIDGLLTKR